MTYIPARLRGTEGFSLAEVVAVLVIIVVAASLATPSLTTVTARHATRGAMGRVSADLAYARLLAVREGRSASLRILSSTRYAITVDEATPDTVKTVELSRDYAGLQLGASASQVTYNSRGLLSDGASKTIWATMKGVGDTVVVLATGRPYRDY